MKEKIKKAIRFLLNPRFLFCFGIAWMITNGWSYVFMVIGTWLDISWMVWVATAWLTFLWIPFTPEKILTVIIAIGLLRWFFPKDEKTLQVLRNMLAKAKNAMKRKKAEKAAETTTPKK